MVGEYDYDLDPELNPGTQPGHGEPFMEQWFVEPQPPRVIDSYQVWSDPDYQNWDWSWQTRIVRFFSLSNYIIENDYWYKFLYEDDSERWIAIKFAKPIYKIGKLVFIDNLYGLQNSGGFAG